MFLDALMAWAAHHCQDEAEALGFASWLLDARRDDPTLGDNGLGNMLRAYRIAQGTEQAAAPLALEWDGSELRPVVRI